MSAYYDMLSAQATYDQLNRTNILEAQNYFYRNLLPAIDKYDIECGRKEPQPERSKPSEEDVAKYGHLFKFGN